MKKIISFILVVILLITSSLSLVSCEKKVSETEAIMIVEDLVKASYYLNEIFYGKGLPYIEDPDGVYDSIYSPVLPEQLIVTEEILRLETKKVFTASYANSILEHALNMSKGGLSGSGSYQRYVPMSDGYLTVMRDYDVIDITEYDYTSINIEKIKRKKIYANITSNKGVLVEVVVIKEENGWRLDSATV